MAIIDELLPWNGHLGTGASPPKSAGPSATEHEAGVEPLRRLIDLAPNLRVVMLHGGTTRDVWARFSKRHRSIARRFRIFGQGAAKRVHLIEAAWLEPMRTCQLFAYRLSTEPFRPHEVGGYWVTSETVEAVERVEVGDLLAQHAAAGIELRITPSIWSFWRRVAGSTVVFSGSRLRNAAPHPDQLP